MEKKLILVHKKRDEFVEKLVQGSRGGKNRGSLIDTLFYLQESEPEFYTHDVIKSVVLLMIIAGTETSAVTIESAMSLLLSNPEAFLKLRQEIDNNIGHNQLLSDTDLSKLPYLRCVVNEALRLYPPVPLLLPHYSSEDCTVGGYKVPKNTILLVNAWGTHMDPKVWNEPHKFKPERFEGMDMEREEGYKFVPFGMGRRACPGAGMGLRTISLAVGAFVQCFEWEKVLEHEDLDMNWKEKAKPLEAMCVPRHQAVNLLSQL
ncbi:hypothetical protein RD792_017588 [Penstemon davidsonii]|uniref:Cytochrome P450 n=1 Tax=Penstemon davidsonii TaxID=160366 RepID=A0ABR0CML1_9LAMI|nr:hypothetical protein RD792_017588 [Penstemon davidsonii]